MSAHDSSTDRGDSEERVQPDGEDSSVPSRRDLPGDIFGPADLHEPPPIDPERLAEMRAEMNRQIWPSEPKDFILKEAAEGYDIRISEPLPTDPFHAAYLDILSEAAEIRRSRVQKRGTYRYTNKDPLSREVLASDLMRKFHRVYMYLTGRAQDYSKEDLREDFLDLANYGIMGVQLGEIEGWL